VFFKIFAAVRFRFFGALDGPLGPIMAPLGPFWNPMTLMMLPGMAQAGPIGPQHWTPKRVQILELPHRQACRSFQKKLLCARRPQDGLRWCKLPKITPSWPKKVPKRAQNGPRWPQKYSKDVPICPQDEPRWPQEGPKIQIQ
jgi:hypothetical protein